MNDKERIENAIIPMMLLNLVGLFTSNNPKEKDNYAEARVTLRNAVEGYMDVKPEKKKRALQRRLERVTGKLYDYYIANKFETRKGFIVLTAWAYALDAQDALTFLDEKYLQLLQELDEQLSKGYGLLDNFDKIHRSAVKHVPKLHALTQEMGYL